MGVAQATRGCGARCSGRVIGMALGFTRTTGRTMWGTCGFAHGRAAAPVGWFRRPRPRPADLGSPGCQGRPVCRGLVPPGSVVVGRRRPSSVVGRRRSNVAPHAHADRADPAGDRRSHQKRFRGPDFGRTVHPMPPNDRRRPSGTTISVGMCTPCHRRPTTPGASRRRGASRFAGVDPRFAGVDPGAADFSDQQHCVPARVATRAKGCPRHARRDEE